MSQSIPYIWNNLQWNIQIIFWLLKLLSTQVMACNTWVLHSAFYSLSTPFPQAMEWQPSTCHTYVCAADNGWHFWHFDFVIINSSVQITSIRGQPLSQPYQQQHWKWATPNVHGKLKISLACTLHKAGSPGNVGPCCMQRSESGCCPPLGPC